MKRKREIYRWGGESREQMERVKWEGKTIL